MKEQPIWTTNDSTDVIWQLGSVFVCTRARKVPGTLPLTLITHFPTDEHRAGLARLKLATVLLLAESNKLANFQALFLVENGIITPCMHACFNENQQEWQPIHSFIPACRNSLRMDCKARALKDILLVSSRKSGFPIKLNGWVGGLYTILQRI